MKKPEKSNGKIPLERRDGLEFQTAAGAGDSLSFLRGAVQENLLERTNKMLMGLTPREERVLRMRFGIGTPTVYTLEEIAEQFRVDPERIQQIEAKALRKLKHPNRSRALRNLLSE